jgi:hypothetical protein
LAHTSSTSSFDFVLILAQGDDHFDEFLALMESHGLYAQALKLCPAHVNTERYVKVTEKY